MQRPKGYAIWIHIVGWILFFSLLLVFTLSMSPVRVGAELVLRFALFAFIYLFIFYLNSWVLLPRLYLRKKYLAYIAVIAALLAAVYFLQPFEKLQHLQTQAAFGPSGPPFQPASPRPPFDAPFGTPPPRPEPQPQPQAANGMRPAFDIVSIILFFMTWSFSTVLQVVRSWRQTEQRATQAEADKANAELSFLKAQINPHFLFNTLNNIYSMAVAKSAETPEAIMKLSNIMRYVTDEVNQDFVPLQSEIDCTADFIQLQRLRIPAKIQVEFTVWGNTEGRMIAPLLFMTFVENVFKYGISSHDPAEVIVRIEAVEDEIRFFCSNKIFPVAHQLERAGIGIANTRSRLEHLYPGRHRLEIGRNGHFTVLLTISDR